MFSSGWLAVCLVGQMLPAGPIETGRGTVTIAGEVTATFGAEDQLAYFNYTDYEHNALRMFRVSLSGMWRPKPRFAFLTEIRSEDVEPPIPYALYVRVRPWTGRKFDIQAGRIPPVFGAFARRSYGTTDNPLIGYPLAYQYLTSVRSDAVPANADDLLAMRARGWRVHYPVGNPIDGPGVPIVSAYRWDTGVQAQIATEHLEAAVAITSGTLANPRVDDDNDGRQISGRVAWKPAVGLVIGGSAARGAFLHREIEQRYEAVYGRKSYPQAAVGADAEYSRGYWVVRGEAIRSQWTLPKINVPFIDRPLTARAAYVETRYRLGPRYFTAARVDALRFTNITGQRLFAGAPTPWEAPVTRLEAGGGLYLQRNLTLRVAAQRNWRPAGRVHNRTYLSAQLAYWF
jgi:hypothetical protein